MKTFFTNWKSNLKSSLLLCLLVILAVNAGGLAFEDGAKELTLAVEHYGAFYTTLLFAFSIVLNTFLLASLVSLMYTVIDLLKKKKA